MQKRLKIDSFTYFLLFSLQTCIYQKLLRHCPGRSTPGAATERKIKKKN